jgi:hypothetical protein
MKQRMKSAYLEGAAISISGTVVASIGNVARHLYLPRVDLSTNIKKYGELCK